MRNFIQKAVRKIEKLDREQILTLINLLTEDIELLETILNSMEDGVIVTDMEYRIRVVNKTARRLLRLHPGELIEKTVWGVITDQETAEFIEKQIKRDDRIVEEEFYTDKGSGTAVLSLNTAPYVKNKKIEGTLLILRDVTEKKQREAQFRRAENLASLTTLAAGVAHEIKNPLASIGIHIQLMKKELQGSGCIDKESGEEYLAIIDEEIERLNSIVVDFLFAVRPMDTRLKSENINKLSEDMLEFVKYELEEHNVTTELHLSPNIPKIEIDQKYMKQVLLNIIKNAIAAMPDGGVLSISTCRKDDRVLIQVKDTGFGISEDNMTKIFEPYFTTKDFGSGLGLTVVYKIIREHGGEIALDSKEGEGTTFTISLPLPQSERSLLTWEEKGVGEQT
ncbi:MAG: PAS domain S-box protein [Spirochaetia bacterium]|nr:PAS domain S-box protein [Spirochaetia bacterium]